jgi:hypothetical protein
MDLAEETGRFLEEYGLVATSLEKSLAVFTQNRASSGFQEKSVKSNELVRTVTKAEDAIRFLAEFTPPVTKHVLVALNPDWSLFLSNRTTGSFADDAFHLARQLKVPVYRVADVPPRIWKRDALRVVMSYEARIFISYDAEGNEGKSVCAMQDGDRWVWESTGPRYAIEETFDYSAKGKRYRFTSDNLRTLLRSLNAPVPSVEDVLKASKLALIKAPGKSQNIITRKQLDDPAFGYYRRGMGYVPHMQTHASSVIHDFEKAIQINPEYEPKVRDHLKEARRIAARS